MIGWLYRYVFRGIGWVLLIGVLTILFATISSLQHRSGSPHPSEPRAKMRR